MWNISLYDIGQGGPRVSPNNACITIVLGCTPVLECKTPIHTIWLQVIKNSSWRMGMVVPALILALGRQRPVDPFEFEATIIYKGSSRTFKVI